MVQQNYFQICIQLNFRSLKKIVFFVYDRIGIFCYITIQQKSWMAKFHDEEQIKNAVGKKCLL